MWGAQIRVHGRKLSVSREERLPACRTVRCVAKAAKKGFGDSNAKTTKQPRVKKPHMLELQSVVKGDSRRPKDIGPDWLSVAKMPFFEEGKPIKALILADNSAICLYNVGGELYCSDASSTAYQFPLVDSKILERESGPAVEVSLDGTVYDLATGKVLEWCPKNTPARAVLGSLKEKTSPVNLKVYPVAEREGTIYVKF